MQDVLLRDKYMIQRGKKAKGRMVCKLNYHLGKLKRDGIYASVNSCVVRAYHRLINMSDTRKKLGDGGIREERWEEPLFVCLLIQTLQVKVVENKL